MKVITFAIMWVLVAKFEREKKMLVICCRCRHGYFHVVNNDYTHWEMYAIGGSANPTINSQGNRFVAPDDRFSKEVLYYIIPDIIGKCF